MSTPQPPHSGDAEPGPGAETLHLADTPGYPLARSVEMPGTLDYPTGSLTFRLGALRLRAEGRPEALAEETRGDSRHIVHRIPALVLTGRYALDTRPDEVREIDTAGNLRSAGGRGTAAHPARPGPAPSRPATRTTRPSAGGPPAPTPTARS
ncbi:hypothetical protein GCM10020000_03490 [Streptomyces olivoverticillatus]